MEALKNGGESALRVLLLTDLVGSTHLVESLGDSRAFDVLSRHDRVARDLLARFEGLEIDKTDGFLLLFERPAQAVAYALEYHQALARLSSELDAELTARTGVHLGEVYLRRNSPEDVARGAKPLEVEGLAKPTAARLMSLAGGRQTLLTRGVFELARRAAVTGELADPQLRWLAHGAYLFQGVEEPVEVFEVGVEGFAPLLEPAGSAKVQRVVALGDELTLGWRPAVGQKIPRRPNWVLRERLGEGGFGEVWLATHKSGDRRVFKFCFEAKRLRGLQREVTLFRLLKEALGHRRDIARILDWNFDAAPYFLEAEYTEGGNLIDWAEEQGGIRGVPLATRLELVAQVAEALAAAHSVGILHKDVKPANVLINDDAGGRPQAALTDFGIGLLTDRDRLAAQGITVLGFTETELGEESTGGTLRYLAPELLEHKASTIQADIYSLGVLLYQMIVGDFSRALASGWRREIEDDLLAEDLARMVDGDPDRRPASALVVAESLRTLEERRDREDAERRARREAEEARQALLRAHRRRKVSAAVAAAAVVLLLVFGWMAKRAEDARREAELRRTQAEDLIGFMIGDLREKLEAQGSLPILSEVGKRAMAYFDSLDEKDLTTTELLRQVQTLTQIGEVYHAQASYPEAITAFQDALELARELAERDPADGERLLQLGNSQFWVGFVHWEQGDLKSAEARFRDYLQAAQRLVALGPDRPEWRLELAYAQSNIGSVQEARGNLEEARDSYEETVEVLERLVASDLARTEWQLELALSYNNLGQVESKLGNLESALRHYLADLEIKEALVAREPENAPWRRFRALALHYVGRIEADLGQTQKAAQRFQAAVRTMADLVATDSTNVEWKIDLAVYHERLGRTLDAQGRSDVAFEHYLVAEKLLQGVLEREPANARAENSFAVTQVRLGGMNLGLGQPVRARAHAHKAVEILEPLIDNGRLSEERRKTLSSAYLLVGRIEAVSQNSGAARSSWLRAAQLLAPQAPGSRDFELLELWARVLLELERQEEARAVVEQLLESNYRDQSFMDLIHQRRLREASASTTRKP